MKILVVAPGSSDLTTLPEISSITTIHHVQLLSGTVTTRRVYDAASSSQYDVVHFASHGGVSGVLLSDGDVLTPEQISAICRVAKARLLFLNSCNMGKVAIYATRHGVDFAIFAVEDIDDDEAWKIPIAFYRSAIDSSDSSLLTAILIADSGEAVYGYAVNPDVLLRYIRGIADLSERVKNLEARSLGNGYINRNEVLWIILFGIVVIAFLVISLRII